MARDPSRLRDGDILQKDGPRDPSASTPSLETCLRAGRMTAPEDNNGDGPGRGSDGPGRILFIGPDQGARSLTAFTRARMLSSGVPIGTPHPAEMELNPASADFLAASATS